MLRRWLGLRSATQLVALHATLGSTQPLFLSLGEVRARQFLELTVNRLAHRAAALSGLVVRSEGSSLLVLFDHAEQALRASWALREELRSWCLNVDAQFELPMEIGLSSGAVLCRPPTYQGETLLRASVLAAAAQGDETLLDHGVVEALPAELAARARPALPAPAFAHVGNVWSLEGERLGGPKVADPLWVNLRSPDGRIHLSFTPERPIRIGRDARSDIAIDSPQISRQHAVIVWRNGCYMLADTSRNGTWVRHQAAPQPVHLQRGVCLLDRSGSLSLGRGPRSGRAPDLLFSVTPPPDTGAAA